MIPQRHFDSRSTDYLEDLLSQYLADPARVSGAWREYFGQFEQSSAQPEAVLLRPAARTPSLFAPGAVPHNGSMRSQQQAELFRERVERLITAYRMRGHLTARLDPLRFVQSDLPELDPATHGLSAADLDLDVSTVFIGGPQHQSLRELIERLRTTYCRYIGIQYSHVDDPAIHDWLSNQMERSENRVDISRRVQWRILSRLTEAVLFEEFVRKKYVAAKSFSLEGSESLVPLIDLALEEAAAQGVREVVIGMAHRGRLNVLANIIGKTFQEIFAEFEDKSDGHDYDRGDVKYHLGHSGEWQTASQEMLHLSLCFNPSHLEYVNSVVLGRTRAKQDKAQDQQRTQCLALIIHGDAAFAGAGVVPETLNLNQLAAYNVGGALHVIVNNQLGFTTPTAQARSTHYPSDVGKMLQSPIFHVNGEHPESVAQVVRLAMQCRARFRRDVIIDMHGYRRWGHNEADEPSFTQPLLYQAIEHRPSVREIYAEHLVELGGISREEAEAMAEAQHDVMREAFRHVREEGLPPSPVLPSGVWEGYSGGEEPSESATSTAVPVEQLKELLGALTQLPNGFHLHRKLRSSVEARRRMAAGDEPLDWSTAEALALATLAVEGTRVRLTGQDTERGTFSQRHAVLHDVVDGSRYNIFQNLSPDQAPVEVLNSPLSEAGALGFEYGFSLDFPDCLVAWEAQFGDFGNAAQVIIDQFMASAGRKWRRLSGLMLLLPHGYEGQGPEHSSARVERFLAMAADDNWQILWPTTPAQYFHLLRRQVRRKWRAPAIVLTPKSLLRDSRVKSSLDELATGCFQRIIADPRHESAPRRVILCSGKMFYDLMSARDEHQQDDIALIRIEQLYPLRDAELAEALARWAPETVVTWVQEEPANMGAWPYWRTRYGDRLLGRYPLRVVSRPASSSPATGSASVHKRQQQELVRLALSDA